MKFKVGDKVKLKDDLTGIDAHGITIGLDSARGKIATVEYVVDETGGIFYNLDFGDYYQCYAWFGDLLELADGTDVAIARMCGAWPMPDEQPKEDPDFYVHTQPGMYKTYQGPKCGWLLRPRAE